MAEEHRLHAQEGHRPCANNCGFFGSPATMNLCTKCYRDLCLKEQQQQQEACIKNSSLSSPSTSSTSTAIDIPSPVLSLPEIKSPEKEKEVAVLEKPSRCAVCRKRVGLTSFKCRCGITFCGSHRYPEKHDCSFDFKKVGREEIAKSNPLVVAEKLRKI